MFPVEPVASSLTGKWGKLAWSKRGWGKGQVSWKLTQGRHWYKLQTFFLLPHNYVSNVQRLDFVKQPPDELGNHIDSRLEWEFSTFFPAMYVQTMYLSVFETPCFLPHVFDKDYIHMVFPSLSYPVFKPFSANMQKHFNGKNTNENMVLYFPSITLNLWFPKTKKR